MPWHSDFTHIRDVGLYTDIFPLKMPLSNAGRHFLNRTLTCPGLGTLSALRLYTLVRTSQAAARRRNHCPLPHRGIESDVENYCRNRRCRWNHFLCGNEEWSRTRKIVVATDAAGGPFSFAATKNGIGRGRSSSQQKLQAGQAVAATKIRIGRSRPSQQRKLVSDAAG